MNGGPLRGCASGESYTSGPAVAAGAAEWLGLAAAPTFAIMALLTGAFGEGEQYLLCSSAHDASLLNGMGLMYALMTAFHLRPWLKLISGRYP